MIIPDTWEILETWYLICYTWNTEYPILNIWYSISDTWHLSLNIWYLILTSSYRNFHTCILLLESCYFLPVSYYYLIFTGTCFFSFFLYDIGYLKLAITCKKIVSFRSCSATRSCLSGFPREHFSHGRRGFWLISSIGTVRCSYELRCSYTLGCLYEQRWSYELRWSYKLRCSYELK